MRAKQRRTAAGGGGEAEEPAGSARAPPATPATLTLLPPKRRGKGSEALLSLLPPPRPGPGPERKPLRSPPCPGSFGGAAPDLLGAAKPPPIHGHPKESTPPPTRPPCAQRSPPGPPAPPAPSLRPSIPTPSSTPRRAGLGLRGRNAAVGRRGGAAERAFRPPPQAPSRPASPRPMRHQGVRPHAGSGGERSGSSVRPTRLHLSPPPGHSCTLPATHTQTHRETHTRASGRLLRLWCNCVSGLGGGAGAGPGWPSGAGRARVGDGARCPPCPRVCLCASRFSPHGGYPPAPSCAVNYNNPEY